MGNGYGSIMISRLRNWFGLRLLCKEDREVMASVARYRWEMEHEEHLYPLTAEGQPIDEESVKRLLSSIT